MPDDCIRDVYKRQGSAGPDYDVVKADEKGQLQRERVRLWYVALTRACDLLLLPRQSDRLQNDWFSLLNADLTQLPTFDTAAHARPATASVEEITNSQDQATWEAEAAVIAASRRSIVWQSPSRHDGSTDEAPGLSDEGVFVGEGALLSLIHI